MYSHTGCTSGVFFFMYSIKQPLTVKHWVIQMNRERQPYWGRPVSGLNPDPLPVKWVEPTSPQVSGCTDEEFPIRVQKYPSFAFLSTLHYPSTGSQNIPHFHQQAGLFLLETKEYLLLDTKYILFPHPSTSPGGVEPRKPVWEFTTKSLLRHGADSKKFTMPRYGFRNSPWVKTVRHKLRRLRQKLPEPVPDVQP